MAINLGKLTAMIGIDTKALEAGLLRAETRLKGFSRIAAIAMHAVRAAFAIGTMVVAAFGVAALNTSKQFGKAMREISTLLDTAVEDVQGLSTALVQLSTMVPDKLKNLTESLYQAISAGIKAGASIGFIEQSAKLAVAAVTQTDRAVDGLTTVLNAFQWGASKAGIAADMLFAGVVRGKMRFEDFQSTLGTFIPYGAALNLKLEDMVGVMATLTQGGIEANRAATGLRAIFMTMLRPTTDQIDAAKRLGVEFGALALQEKGLAGYLAYLNEKLGDNEAALAALFPESRALLPILNVAGKMAGQFAENTEYVATNLGLVERANAKMMEGMGVKWQLAWNAMNQDLISVGTKMQTPLKALADWTFELFAGKTQLIRREIAILSGLMDELGDKAKDSEVFQKRIRDEEIRIVREYANIMRTVGATRNVPMPGPFGMTPAVTGAEDLKEKRAELENMIREAVTISPTLALDLAAQYDAVFTALEGRASMTAKVLLTAWLHENHMTLRGVMEDWNIYAEQMGEIGVKTFEEFETKLAMMGEAQRKAMLETFDRLEKERRAADLAADQESARISEITQKREDAYRAAAEHSRELMEIETLGIMTVSRAQHFAMQQQRVRDKLTIEFWDAELDRLIAKAGTLPEPTYQVPTPGGPTPEYVQTQRIATILEMNARGAIDNLTFVGGALGMVAEKALDAGNALDTVLLSVLDSLRRKVAQLSTEGGAPSLTAFLSASAWGAALGFLGSALDSITGASERARKKEEERKRAIEANTKAMKDWIEAAAGTMTGTELAKLRAAQFRLFTQYRGGAIKPGLYSEATVEAYDFIKAITGIDYTAAGGPEALRSAIAKMADAMMEAAYSADTYSGAMELLNDRWAVYDVEDPAQKIEDLTDAAADLGFMIPEGVDLEQWRRDALGALARGAPGKYDPQRPGTYYQWKSDKAFWDMLAASGMSAEDARALILSLDSLSDEVAEAGEGAGPTSVSYRATVGITEVQANVLVGVLNTISLNTNSLRMMVDEGLQLMRAGARYRGGTSPATVAAGGDVVEDELMAAGTSR